MSKKTSPSMDSWLKEAKAHESAPKDWACMTP